MVMTMMMIIILSTISNTIIVVTIMMIIIVSIISNITIFIIKNINKKNVNNNLNFQDGAYEVDQL